MPNISMVNTFEHESYGVCTISRVEQFAPTLQSVINVPPGYNAIAYEIHTKIECIGTIGLLWKIGQNNLELFHYFNPEVDSSVVCNVLDLWVDAIFKNTSYPSILFNSMIKSSHFTSITVEHCGFLKSDMETKKYVLTRFDRALQQLTKLIQTENLLPDLNNLVDDIANRASFIWYKYFSQGKILLSVGGVKYALLTFANLDHQLKVSRFSFNQYNENNHLPYTRDELINFFIEEKSLSNQTTTDHLSFSFCLGSHEGFVRVARCIYHHTANNSMFFPVGSYGLLATGISDLKPASFHIHLVNVTQDAHEKISLSHLSDLTEQFPSCKTLFIDVKTTTGSIYTTSEMMAIAQFCKQKNLFLVVDTAHMNMGFSPQDEFPDFHSMAHTLDFHDFIILYTASKTYGLERGRVGFIIFDNLSKFTTFNRIDSDLSRIYGSVCEVPILLSAQLIKTPVAVRRQHTRHQAMNHRYNMNLMLAYIQGVHSTWMDKDLKEGICAEVPIKYHHGIPELRVYNKPKIGLQMKVDTSLLYKKYFGNIHLFNSEMLIYALMLYSRVVALHSYQILDPDGFSIRLSFAFKSDVHQGMQRFHDLLGVLNDSPTPNRFMPGVEDADSKIFTSTLAQSFQSNLATIASQKARFFQQPHNRCIDGQLTLSNDNNPLLKAKL
jgi:hypothetical protein